MLYQEKIRERISRVGVLTAHENQVLFLGGQLDGQGKSPAEVRAWIEPGLEDFGLAEMADEAEASAIEKALRLASWALRGSDKAARRRFEERLRLALKAG